MLLLFGALTVVYLLRESIYFWNWRVGQAHSRWLSLPSSFPSGLFKSFPWTQQYFRHYSGIMDNSRCYNTTISWMAILYRLALRQLQKITIMIVILCCDVSPFFWELENISQVVIWLPKPTGKWVLLYELVLRMSNLNQVCQLLKHQSFGSTSPAYPSGRVNQPLGGSQWTFKYRRGCWGTEKLVECALSHPASKDVGVKMQLGGLAELATHMQLERGTWQWPVPSYLPSDSPQKGQ